jgi:hypothetical protein
MFWIVAQVPQFVSNFSRQSADALSPWFLVQWLAVSIYFCSLDAFCFSLNSPKCIFYGASSLIVSNDDGVLSSLSHHVSM